jgi:hypothetical protein
VVALWPEQNGGHPTIGYQTAFAVNLTLQVAWFLPPRARRRPLPAQQRCVPSTYQSRGRSCPQRLGIGFARPAAQ